MSLLNQTFAVYGGLGLFGLLLSAVGLAGVTTYAVAGVALALLTGRLLGGYLNAFAGVTRVSFADPMIFGSGLTLLS